MSHKVYDAHSHFILPEYFREVSANWLAEDAVPLPSRWTPEEHLEYMDEAGIEWSLLSLSSPHPYYRDDRRCAALMRSLNESLADIKRRFPGRFGFAAALPHPNNEAAAAEAVYALDTLGADAIKLASNSRGLYMGDERMEPLFDELDKRGAVVVMHPHRPAQMQEDVFTANFPPAYEFLCDTTRAVLNVILRGVLDRHPNIKLVVPHSGAFLPNICARMEMTVELFTQLGKMEHIDIKKNLARLYFDTSGNYGPSTEFLLTCADPAHIMYGSDYPFIPRERAVKALEGTKAYFAGSEKLAPLADSIFFGACAGLFGLKGR